MILSATPLSRRRIPLAALVLAAIIGFTGCSSTTNDDKDQTPTPTDIGDIEIPANSTVTASIDRELGTVAMPLDRFASSQNDEVTRLWYNALLSLTEQCLDEKNIAYTRGTLVSPGAGSENTGFGLLSLKSAQVYGFAPNRERDIPKSMPAQPTQEATDAQLECGEEADKQLIEIGTFLDTPSITSQIEQYSFHSALVDPEGKAAIERRAVCLEQSGLSLDEEREYLGDSYFDLPVEEQIIPATQLVQCQFSTGAAQTLFDLMAKYEAAYIDKYEAQLNEVAAETEKVKNQLADFASGA